MQQSNNGETSDQLWFTLRRAFMAMVGDYHLHVFVHTDALPCTQDRLDLAEAAKPENKPDLELFRTEGFDY